MDLLNYNFNNKNEDFSLSGFSGYESWGCWSNGGRSIIKINPRLIEDNRFEKILLSFRPFCPSIRSSFSFDISTSWGFKEFFTVNSNNLINLLIPVKVNPDYQIIFQTRDLASPFDFGISEDRRQLGIGLTNISLGKIDSVVEQNELKTVDMYSLVKSFCVGKKNESELTYFCDRLLGSGGIIADALSRFILNYFYNKKFDEALDIFVAACLLKSIHPEAIHNFKLALKLICDNEFDIGKKFEDCETNERSNQIAVVGGFFYSGSSAVYDYLRGFERSTTLADYDSELPLVGKSYQFINKYNNNAYELARYFLFNLVNIFIPGSCPEDLNLKRKEFSIFESIKQNHGRVSMVKYSEIVLKFVNKIVLCDPKQFREYFTEFVLSCSGSDAANKNSTLILNQSPTAMYIEPLRVFDSRVHFLAVCRDPRDQYLDQLNSGHLYSDVYEFISKYLKDRIAFDSLSIGIRSANISIISFEEFVFSSSLRESIAQELGLKIDKLQSKYFVQGESEKNIGIYKTVENESIKKIC